MNKIKKKFSKKKRFYKTNIEKNAKDEEVSLIYLCM